METARLGVSDAEAAWAAGLFEGEGSWTSVSATILMTDEEPIRLFHDIVGIGGVRESIGKRGVPRWRWRARSPLAVGALYELLEPWLGARRVGQYLNTKIPSKRSLRELFACEHCGEMISWRSAHLRACPGLLVGSSS